MRVTLRAKLAAVVGLAAVAFLLLVGASAIIARRVEIQLDAIRDRYIPKVEFGPKLESGFQKVRRGLQDAVASQDLDLLAEANSAERSLLEELAAAREAVDPAQAAALRAALEDYYAAAVGVSRRLIAEETGEPIVEAIAAMQKKQARAEEAVRTATAFDRRVLAEAFASAREAETAAATYGLAISVACLSSVILLSVWIGRGALNSLNDLTAGFVRFGTGDFGQPIRVGSDDELGDVARHANEMAANLERLGRETRKTEAKFRSLLESAPDAMVIVDGAGQIVFVNTQTEKLFGYPREELLGRTAEILVFPEGGPDANPVDVRSLFGDPKARPIGSAVEMRGRRKDGSEVAVEILSSPLDTDEGTLVSNAIRDITERKRVESALKLSNRELEAFSYSVAHDLRAPLRGINGFSQALLEDSGDKLDDEGKEFLQRILAGTERMGHLIDALLSLSRITRVAIDREVVDLTRLAQTVMSHLRAAQPQRSVEFVNQEGVQGYGDPELLRALLENLLGNAWKFTGARADARIAFGCSTEAGIVTYYVQDNGAGFDMAHANKLFTPFQRLHSADEFVGTGVGLATVQRIVQRHAGRIWAEAGVGRGATFRFTLGGPATGANR